MLKAVYSVIAAYSRVTVC